MIPLPENDNIEYISKPQKFAFEETWFENATDDHFWMRYRFRVLITELKKLNIHLNMPLKILDVGSGFGVVRSQFESVSNWSIDCSDIDANALKHAVSKRGRNLYYNISDCHIDLMNQYDIVFLFDILEHIKETKSFVESTLKHLKKRGCLVINVPAFNMLFSRYDTAAQHYRRYSKNTLAEEFKGTRLRILKQRYWGLSMIPLLFVRKFAVSFKSSNADVLNKGFKPPSEIINRIMFGTLNVEHSVFNSPPLGTSLILVGEKT